MISDSHCWVGATVRDGTRAQREWDMEVIPGSRCQWVVNVGTSALFCVESGGGAILFYLHNGQELYTFSGRGFYSAFLTTTPLLPTDQYVCLTETYDLNWRGADGCPERVMALPIADGGDAMAAAMRGGGDRRSGFWEATGGEGFFAFDLHAKVLVYMPTQWFGAPIEVVDFGGGARAGVFPQHCDLMSFGVAVSMGGDDRGECVYIVVARNGAEGSEVTLLRVSLLTGGVDVCASVQSMFPAFTCALGGAGFARANVYHHVRSRFSLTSVMW